MSGRVGLACGVNGRCGSPRWVLNASQLCLRTDRAQPYHAKALARKQHAGRLADAPLGKRGALRVSLACQHEHHQQRLLGHALSVDAFCELGGAVVVFQGRRVRVCVMVVGKGG